MIPCQTWTLVDAECVQTAYGRTHTLTLSLSIGSTRYEASVSMRPGDEVPRYDMHRIRHRRPPLVIWPEDGSRQPITPRSQLHTPVTELRTHWTAFVCSMVIHARLNTHSPYCPSRCPIPLHGVQDAITPLHRAYYKRPTAQP